MYKLILIILPFILSACAALNEGFPSEINGKLKPINSKEVMENVK